MTLRTDGRNFKSITRRELLKLTPVTALGAFAIPKFQMPLLKAGLGFSDWASKELFRSGHLARTFADSELTPFSKFPINDYDVDDPEVDLEKWTLSVNGAVQKPADYTLAQIRALPKIIQNTRHVCVEGWDVIGRFGGSRLSDFLKTIGADPTARFHPDRGYIGRGHTTGYIRSVTRPVATSAAAQTKSKFNQALRRSARPSFR